MKNRYGTDTRALSCPYCGEAIEVIVDCSVKHQEYVEDCSVCCRPMTLTVDVRSDGTLVVTARDENEC